MIAHADNADFCTSGEECEVKIQETIACYAKRCEATDDKVQKEKASIFC